MKALFLVLLVAVVSSQVIVTNFGCKNLSADGVTCLECSNRFFKDADGICQPVSDACKTYDKGTGACTSCYDGFLLLEVICFKDPKPKDPNCANFSNGNCVKCSNGFYLKDLICEQIHPQCKTFDYQALRCTECYSGFRLDSAFTCILGPLNSDLVGCAKINGTVC